MENFNPWMGITKQQIEVSVQSTTSTMLIGGV